MKKLIILSHGRITGQNLVKELNKIFGDLVEIKSYASDDSLPEDFSEHLILVTTDVALKGPFSKILNANVQWIMAQRVINYKYLQPLIELEAGTEVLFVNDHEGTTTIAIEQLKGLGLNHIHYIPYYPGCRLRKAYDIAVTPGEPHLVPASSKSVIDIETRQIDLTTIIEIADRLGLLSELKSTLSSQYLSDFVDILRKLSQKAEEARALQDSFMTLADNSNDGIVYTDYEGRIVLLNRAAKRYFSHSNPIDKNIYSLLALNEKKNKDKEEREIISINGREVFLSLKLVKEENDLSDKIFLLEDVSELRKLEHELRRKSRKNEHVARYDFKDILYQSIEMEETITLAKKLARSDSTILLEGESGTGKELMAQAIHLNSSKSDGPFVPVNFAAIPYTLLESELFGYEEGAFTGAKKGGKVGLIEEAHGGTLFLDEIGDAPLEFQVRLLRVLQEKQIRRVGGRKQIPINIRVIAATNINLIKAVEKQEFREDLFYRISVLPIVLPALRERKGDVLFLMQHYLDYFLGLNHMRLEKFISDEALKYLMQYAWSGNIRQLVNLAEYLVNIREDGVLIEKRDLPSYMLEGSVPEEDTLIKNLLGDDLLWILEQIDYFGNVGRRQLTELALDQEVKLSEGKIRTLMDRAESLGLIRRGQGRKGSWLTESGIEVLNRI